MIVCVCVSQQFLAHVPSVIWKISCSFVTLSLSLFLRAKFPSTCFFLLLFTLTYTMHILIDALVLVLWHSASPFSKEIQFFSTNLQSKIDESETMWIWRSLTNFTNWDLKNRFLFLWPLLLLLFFFLSSLDTILGTHSPLKILTIEILNVDNTKHTLPYDAF